MVNIQQLQTQRKELAVQARSLIDSVGPEKWSEQEQAKYDEMVDKITNLDGAIDREQKQLQIEAAALTMATDRADRTGESVDEAHSVQQSEREVFAAFLRGGIQNLTDKQREIVERRKARNQIDHQGTSTPADGGYLVPDEFSARLIRAMEPHCAMRDVAHVYDSSSGAPTGWPTVDDSEQVGEIVGEGEQVSSERTSFGMVSIGSYKYSSKDIGVSFELLQDSAVDIEGYIVGLLAKKIGRITNRHFTHGTGSKQPRGFMTCAQEGFVSSSAAEITYDDLIELEHSLKSGFRKGSRFMLSDGALKSIKKLRDGNGAPLWMAGMTSSEPGQIMGYGYTINEEMDAPGAEARPIAFGAFSNYIIRDALAVNLHRMEDSYYTRNGLVGFLAFSRHDGTLLDVGGESVKYLKMAAA